MFISIFNKSVPTSQKRDQIVNAVSQITTVFSENLIEHIFTVWVNCSLVELKLVIINTVL